MKKTLWVGLTSLLFVILAALVVFWFGKPASFRGTSYGEPYPAAPSFGLTRSNSETFRLDDQRGKIVLLFFGYTSCPDVCPTTMAEMKLVMDSLGDAADTVQVVFISVDPERDTPEKIQKYVEHFNSNFIGLTGSMDELQPIWDAYGVYRAVNETDSAFGYIVDHTARVTLVDADGNLRLSYGFQTPVEDIVHDIKLLLK
ncbi:MAG: SCO family protein [Anaerolineaceae bacterium]|nr:MAG: SCO family protein [Anaerolineaceae bacterium]